MNGTFCMEHFQMNQSQTLHKMVWVFWQKFHGVIWLHLFGCFTWTTKTIKKSKFKNLQIKNINNKNFRLNFLKICSMWRRSDHFVVVVVVEAVLNRLKKYFLLIETLFLPNSRVWKMRVDFHQKRNLLNSHNYTRFCTWIWVACRLSPPLPLYWISQKQKAFSKSNRTSTSTNLCCHIFV